jgi:hypothetical protein
MNDEPAFSEPTDGPEWAAACARTARESGAGLRHAPRGGDRGFAESERA